MRPGEADVPLALATLPINLRYDGDLPTAHGRPIPPPENDEPIDRGLALMAANRYEEAIAAFGQSTHQAWASFYIGQCLDALERFDEANDFYKIFVQQNPLNRTRPSYNEFVRELAGERGLPLIDLERRLEDRFRGGLPPDELWMDYCHMSWMGYLLMASDVVETLLKERQISGARGEPLPKPNLDEIITRYHWEKLQNLPHPHPATRERRWGKLRKTPARRRSEHLKRRRFRTLVFALIPAAGLLLGATVVLNVLEERDVVETERLDDRVAQAPLKFVRRVETAEGPVYRLDDSSMLIPATFPVEKKDGTFRLFVTGGSFAMGTPYVHQDLSLDPPMVGDIANWVDAELSLRFPSRRFEVINAGAGAQNSTRVRAIVGDLVQLGPDAILIMTGNNEGYVAKTIFNEPLHHWIVYRALKKTLLPVPDPRKRSYFTPQDPDTQKNRAEISEQHPRDGRLVPRGGRTADPRDASRQSQIRLQQCGYPRATDPRTQGRRTLERGRQIA
ncbi:MAG: hypothetical protein M5R36_29090 [Deltaproteobacteria bacterium]|nr:hypothetical protein [Deltaproteobacteria bacterium]